MDAKQLCLAVTAGFVLLATSACSRDVSFAENIHPMLEQRCGTCHENDGEGVAASGFSVASYDDLMKGTKYGPVIEPGNSLNSSFMLLVEQKTSREIHMPRGSERLNDEQIAMLKTWIDGGARNN